MVNAYILALAGIAVNVHALPLNINLGAYSPALVVGDGEISFGGRSDVNGLMNALEGAAVSAAAGAGAAAGTAAAGTAAAGTGAGRVQAAAVPVVAATPAAEAPAVVAAAADPQLEQEATSIATLQGMGKEIAPREGETESTVAKRDLSGFDRALLYAEAALVKGPVVQLGTGEGGAGVGIIVDNRPAAGAAAGGAAAARPATEAAAGGAAAPVVARDESSVQPKQRRTKVTTMYIKRGLPTSLQSSEDIVARHVQSLPFVTSPSEVAKRDSSSAIDAVNLNVEGGEGITMTFVETADEDDEE